MRKTRIVLIHIIVLLVLAAIAVPLFIRARTQSLRNACLNNLRQIDGAKESWAMANNKPVTAMATPEDLDPYIKHGWSRNQCPSKGEYTIGRLGESPTCSVHGGLRTLRRDLLQNKPVEPTP